MNFRAVWTIFRKEILETLRDKRALMAMIGIPVLLYPLLIIVATQAMTVQHGKLERETSRVVLVEGTPEEVRECIARAEKVEIIRAADARAGLESGEVDAIVSAEPDAAGALAGAGTAKVRVAYDSTAVRSGKARRRVADALGEQSRKILEGRLEGAKLAKEFIEPIHVASDDVAPAEKRTASIFGKILPLIMIMMLGVGAFYPAVDLTAGEKERGTFETLLSTPTSKLEIVAGKFLTIFVISLITALLNLASMVGSILFQLVQFSNQMPDPTRAIDLSMFHISVGSVATIFLILVPLAFFICSVMMSIALLARSFREAQNYVTPFFIFIMLPGMIAAMPGMELSPTTMFIPIANVALLLKDLLMEKATLELTFGVFLCTGVYALLSLVVAVWMFQREDVILSQEKGIPLTFRRSALQPRDQATPGQALLLFALTLLLLFYAATWVQVRWGIWGLFVTQWGLLLAPAVGVLWLGRVNLRESLSLRRPPPAAWPGAVLMAAGMLVVVLQVHVWQSWILPVSQEVNEQMSRALGLGQVPLAVLLLGAAVSPAICEEVLFRGGILSGLRGRLPAWAQVVVVGLLFGLFHLSVHRVVPTAVLGIAITYAAVRSGSIFPAMLMHLLHNTTVLLAGTGNLPGPVLALFDNAEAGGAGFGPWVLAVALAALAAGVACMEFGARSGRLPTGSAPP